MIPQIETWRRSSVAAAAIAGLSFLLTATAADASFHFMQIEQVVGGVQSDITAQAIQLRMRVLGQNDLNPNVRLVVRDNAGNNPITILVFPADVPNFGLGSRVLIASTQFANTQMPPGVAPDFTMTNLIPSGYLAGGSLTFEQVSDSAVFWRLSWGTYTGSLTGTIDNDADGNFGPKFAGALPSTTNQALRFTGAAADPSTNNAANYALTPGNAVFTNNAGSTGTLPVELLDFAVE